jgi:hypothetical protein
VNRYQKIARDLELKKESNSQRQKVPRSLSSDDKKHHELVLREAELKIQLEKQRRLQAAQMAREREIKAQRDRIMQEREEMIRQRDQLLHQQRINQEIIQRTREAQEQMTALVERRNQRAQQQDQPASNQQESQEQEGSSLAEAPLEQSEEEKKESEELGQLTNIFMQLTAMKALLETRISNEEQRQQVLRVELRNQAEVQDRIQGELERDEAQVNEISTQTEQNQPEEEEKEPE